MRINYKFILLNLLKDVFKNKLRFFLTIFGIIIAGLVLIVGYILIDSYYYSNFKKYSYFNENQIVEIKCFDRNIKFENEDLVKNNSNLLLFVKDYHIGLKYPYIVGNKSINIITNIYRTNSNFNGSLIRTDFEVKQTSLIKGTTFSNENINNQDKVIVISSNLEKMLFDEDGIGEELKIPIYKQTYIPSEDGWLYEIDYYEIFSIVGIYQSLTEDTNNLISELENKDSFTYMTDCYIPFSVSIGKNTNNESDYVFYNIENQIDFERQINLNYSNQEYAFLYSYNSFVIQLEEQLESIRFFLNLLIIIICIFSILIITSIMIFSTKEQISEIGIKKALGARDENLFFEIIIKTIIHGIIAYIISLFIAYIISLIIINIWHANDLFTNYFLIIKFETILLSFLIIQLTCLISAFFPAIYAIRIQITDAIKFE